MHKRIKYSNYFYSSVSLSSETNIFTGLNKCCTLGRFSITLEHINKMYMSSYVTLEPKARPVARIFTRGITWVCDVYACKTRGCGGMLPRKLLGIRCSGIASEAIFWTESGP